ncbi:MAG: ComEC/Rec2 family competence protein [Chthonomonadales bacterium]
MINRRGYLRLSALFAACGGALWLWPTPAHSGLKITFLDVGQGDSIVVETPDNHVLIVDTGGSMGKDNMGHRVVVPFLRSHGIRSIDGLLMTHPDEDHIAGADWILQNFPVKHVMISGIPSENFHYNSALETARKKSIPVQLMCEKTFLDFHDGVTAEALNPSEDTMVSHNNGSIVLRVKYGVTGILLTGDAEIGAELRMVSLRANLKADVLKLGHHGSHTSSTDPFMDAVHPQAVVISAGRKNRFGHPHRDVVDRMKVRGIRVFRTDLQGSIELTSDGKHIEMSGKKPLAEADQWLSGSQVH